MILYATDIFLESLAGISTVAIALLAGYSSKNFSFAPSDRGIQHYRPAIAVLSE